MSQRLARRSAGDRVLARAQRLSDDTLRLEKGCSLAVRRTFHARMGIAVEAFGAGWKRAKGDPKALPKDARMVSRISEAHDRAIAQTEALLEGLTRDVLALTIASITDELTVCEKTLTTKYAGVTEEAMTRVRMAGDDVWLAPRLKDYADSAGALGTWFTQQVKKQVQFAGMYGDDQGKAARRLFSPQPNRLKGNSGMGMWWRTASELDALVTEASVTLQSQVRNAAMGAFNEAGATR